MASRKLRRSLLALTLVVSSFGLLPPLDAAPRIQRSAAPRALWSAPGEHPWGLRLSFWHLLNSLWGKSGAKIDGNG
jgi:hypothetical protein